MELKKTRDQLKKLINENQKKIEIIDKIKSFMKSIYGKELYEETIDKLTKKLKI